LTSSPSGKALNLIHVFVLWKVNVGIISTSTVTSPLSNINYAAQNSALQRSAETITLVIEKVSAGK
jgi:hypothetical protein